MGSGDSKTTSIEKRLETTDSHKEGTGNLQDPLRRRAEAEKEGNGLGTKVSCQSSTRTKR